MANSTEECKALQDKIEELVRAGHFRRFIRRDDHSSSSRSHYPHRSDHKRPQHDSRHDRRPAQPTNQEPESARTDITPTDPPYAAPSTPSLVASLVEDPLLLPEKDTSAISNPSTISPNPTTDAACLPSSSQMTTFMASTINKMTSCSSRLKSKTTPLRKFFLTKATSLTSSTGPPTKNSNFQTPLWSRMMNQYMASLANKFPPAATSTSTPSFVREPKPKPFQSASSSSMRQHPTMSS